MSETTGMHTISETLPTASDGGERQAGRRRSDRLVAASPGQGDRRGDAVSALVNLGYSQRDAVRSVDAVWSDASGEDLGELLRLALQKLTR